MPLIEGPNGEEIEFPDDMPHEAISAAMRKQFGGPAAVSAHPNVPMIERPSLSEEISNSADFAEKLGNSAMFNFGDEVAATVGALPNWLTGGRYGKSRSEILKETRERMKRYDTEHPTETTVADVGGKGLAALAMPQAATARMLGAAPGLLRSTGIGALFGGLGSAADEAGKQEGGFDLGKVAESGAYGAGIGGGLSGGANVAGRVVGPWVSQAARYLHDRGVRLTPGELLGGVAKNVEDALTSVPGVGNLVQRRQREGIESFNRTAWDEALEPIRTQTRGTSHMPRDIEMGREAQDEARNIFNRRYRSVVARLSAEADAPLTAQIAAISGRLPQTVRPQLANAYDRHILPNINQTTGIIPGRGLQDSLQGLRREARNLRRNPGHAYDVDLADGLERMREALEASASRHSSVRDMNAFRNVNSAYQRYATLRDAGSRLGAEEGVFTPTHLTSAVHSSDKSVGKGQYARGAIPMQQFAETGKNVMRTRIGNSGSAERLTALGVLGGGSHALGITPETLAATGALAALYTRPGNRAFQHLATVSPRTRTMLRRAMERAGVKGGTVAAREYTDGAE
jgi:hypothetical protein